MLPSGILCGFFLSARLSSCSFLVFSACHYWCFISVPTCRKHRDWFWAVPFHFCSLSPCPECPCWSGKILSGQPLLRLTPSPLLVSPWRVSVAYSAFSHLPPLRMPTPWVRSTPSCCFLSLPLRCLRVDWAITVPFPLRSLPSTRREIHSFCCYSVSFTRIGWDMRSTQFFAVPFWHIIGPVDSFLSYVFFSSCALYV